MKVTINSDVVRVEIDRPHVRELLFEIHELAFCASEILDPIDPAGYKDDEVVGEVDLVMRSGNARMSIEVRHPQTPDDVRKIVDQLQAAMIDYNTFPKGKAPSELLNE